MQKIVLFIEPHDSKSNTPCKIGNSFINRFVINDDAGFEIVKILELSAVFQEMTVTARIEEEYEYERNLKGMNLKLTFFYVVDIKMHWSPSSLPYYKIYNKKYMISILLIME